MWSRDNLPGVFFVFFFGGGGVSGTGAVTACYPLGHWKQVFQAEDKTVFKLQLKKQRGKELTTNKHTVIQSAV